MILNIIGVIYTVLVLPPLVYLLLISVAVIKKPRTLNSEKTSSSQGTIGILIPAHNEKLTIERTLASVASAAANSHDIDINVIADNCSDNTAELARHAGANVLERENKDLRGKGAALQWAMATLAEKHYDYTMIIDADIIVNPEFFQELRVALGSANTGAVQTRYEALANEHASVKRLAMLGFNVLRGRGRVALGGSAGIMGNGFILSQETLAKVPFLANSIVEDLEYHMQLVASNIPVAFCDSARICGEMPNDDQASDIQASRWEGGRLGVLKAKFLPLLCQSITGIFKGKVHALDALLDLMLLPIGYMVMIILIGLAIPTT